MDARAMCGFRSRAFRRFRSQGCQQGGCRRRQRFRRGRLRCGVILPAELLRRIDRLRLVVAAERRGPHMVE
eukprot:2482422-Prymnesium_polylepis.2